MANFSIRTATDPDLGSREGIDQHKLATETFQRILWALCIAAQVFNNDHERAYGLYQRAAYAAALELGCELRVEDKGDETEITFDFVGSVIITEPLVLDKETGATVLPYKRYDPVAEIMEAINGEEDWDLDDAALTREAEDQDADAPELKVLNRGAGLWALVLDGRVVLDNESYAVVHGIVENADVDELRELRDSLTAGV